MSLKPGLSGFVRAKNEGKFIGASIDSCIDALDELVVVYNDCTDNTEDVIRQKIAQYPSKIKAYKYEHQVIVNNLTKDEFEYIKSLPDDDPRIFATQCNFALSKISYEFAIKIDPDQIYFLDEISTLRNICKSKDIKWNIGLIFGWLFRIYLSLYRRLSSHLGKPCLWMISWIHYLSFFVTSYKKYCFYRLKKKKAAISFSGVNVFYDGKWTIPFDGINIHPPYNGEGDLLVFPVSPMAKFVRRYVDNAPYAVWEAFVHPYKVLAWPYPIWFHFHANRDYCADKVQKTKLEHPDWFVEPKAFTEMNYKEVHDKMSHKSHTLYQRTLFGIIHTFGKKHIKPHLYMLDKFMPPFMKNQFNKY